MQRSLWRDLLQIHENKIYLTLVNGCHCGPWDGGCVAVALAIHRTIGGELCVLVREDDTADHAVVLKDGMLYDFSGPKRPRNFIETFNKLENRFGDFASVGYRPMKDGDLPDASRDESLVNELATLYRAMIPTAFHAQEESMTPQP
jgi:hypothetical protein